ncbi:MAG: sugar ABC transporter permease [Bacilli bacterium]|nr:sugar ABC transporter permease [Bacilli bacterium]
MTDAEGLVSKDLIIPRRKKKVSKETWFGIIAVSIPLLSYLIFNFFPLMISFALQFCSIENSDLSTMVWNNFGNFKEVFADPKFYLSIGVTFFVTLAQFISLAISLFISVLLHKKPIGAKLFAVLFFIPYICSSVATAMMWQWMFNSQRGIINTILVALAGEGARVNWFSDADAYRWTIIIATVWAAPGYGIVMYKAALNAVNPTLYEAADIDGANSLKKFVKITLPSIAPTTFYLLMTGIIAGLQSFDIANMFALIYSHDTIGGPQNAGLTLVRYIYYEATEGHNMGIAAVMSWVLFIIVFIASFINFRTRRKWVNE